ncbi:MAG: hypothetical protein BMS9Abin12_0295 [Acidimicrobiia bacterium]|nr:MAG: hypothetical protein BMS9Abin12_0295 [Acidimicrobiia bacterium]
MPSIKNAEVVIDLSVTEVLADVIPLPNVQVPSFYQKSGRRLPRLDSGGSAAYTRASLPTPVKPEPETVIARLKDFFRVNRPSWLPQR